MSRPCRFENAPKPATAGVEKPHNGLGVQVIYVGEGASAQEVLLHVLNRVLHLALGLRGGLAAEHALEVLRRHKAPEGFRQESVAEVLVLDEDAVLVVDELLPCRFYFAKICRFYFAKN